MGSQKPPHNGQIWQGRRAKKKKDEKTKLEIKSTERRKFEMRYFCYLVVVHDRLKVSDLRIGVCFAPAKSMSHFNSL